jgi:hypothetical protein
MAPLRAWLLFVQSDSLRPLTLDGLDDAALLRDINLVSGRRSRELDADFNEHLVSAAALPMPGIPIPTGVTLDGG